jgi:hypothetical protein
MSGRHRKLHWVFVLLLIAAVGGAVIIGVARHDSVDCIARAVGTNVNGVSVWVTLGPTHTLYYPSRLRWEWDRACKRLSLPVKSDPRFIGVITNTPTTGITNSPTLGSDLLWIAIEYRERLSVIGQLVAEEVDEGGRIHRLAGTFVKGVSNYVVSIEKGVFDSPDMPARKVYRIIKHDGVEYLFDERGNAVKKFEETKDERELRHAWRREGG